VRNANTLRLLLSVLPAKAGIQILQKSDWTPPVVYPVLRHGAGAVRVQGFGGSKRKSFHRIAAVLLAMRAVPCALAEETVVLPEITVTGEREYPGETGVASTATRLPESILDTPRSVNVVPESVIADRAILDPQEAIQDVSGVQRGATRTGVASPTLSAASLSKRSSKTVSGPASPQGSPSSRPTGRLTSRTSSASRC